MTHPGGAPRTVSLPPDEMIELGKEMVKWVKTHDVLHLSEWYTIEKGYTYNQWKTMHICQEFFPYYEQALKVVGRKYLDKNSNIRDGISHRWLRVYFKDFKEEEDAKIDYEAQARSNADIKTAQAIAVLPINYADAEKRDCSPPQV